MIVVNAKTAKQSLTLSQLLLGVNNPKDQKFAKLLESMQTGTDVTQLLSLQDDDEPLQNKLQTLLLALGNDNVKEDVDASQLLKNTTLLQLLQGEASVEKSVASITRLLQQEGSETDDTDVQFLHPKTINLLSTEELRSVVIAAKQFLKTKIQTIASEQNIQIKQLPQTLGGLSEMAHKLGLDLETITLDEIEAPISKNLAKNREAVPLLDTAKTRTFVENTTRTVMAQKHQKTTVSTDENILKTALQIKAKENHPKEVEKVLQTEKTVSTEKTLQTSQVVVAKLVQPMTRLDTSSSSKEEHKNEIKPNPLTAQKTETISIKSDAELPMQATESANASKATRNSATPKQSSGTSEALFSAIASDETKEVLSESQSKNSSIGESKALHIDVGNESKNIEIKNKEAQQMMRHFATDLKEAVENYKPPFTRLKMVLNPAKLGEVDVTLIQRGNNIHINVSSNNTALNLLAQNVTELKTQLANNGVVNTTMQFSTSHGEHQQQEGRHQQFQEFYKSMDQFSDDELEQITSMEITFPQYA